MADRYPPTGLKYLKMFRRVHAAQDKNIIVKYRILGLFSLENIKIEGDGMAQQGGIHKEDIDIPGGF